jgi:uncharacterized protein (DUF362 family)/NAD-dependent dihydropyrimidine dehydrogenase PreA subunit
VIKNKTRVLVKVNMGCSGVRQPEKRLGTHPVVLEAIVRALLDCGATVSFGDDVARAGRYSEHIYRTTGMLDVAKRTGAALVDFVALGAREVRGRLACPRHYLITNAYFDADVVINAASCRSHVGIGMSGAVKNMFGCVIGSRKQLIHNLFPGSPRLFGRAIADVYRTIPADFSFLDATTVAEAAGSTLAVRPVGLLLGSGDAVAADTVASHAIGYQGLSIWPSYYASKWGIGCNVMRDIKIQGLDWNSVEKRSLEFPMVTAARPVNAYHRQLAILNNTLLRPRPVIAAHLCTGCGDCERRCPVNAIGSRGSAFAIDLSKCADCGCCLKTCEAGAVSIEFVGLARTVRRVLNRMPEAVSTQSAGPLDPAPMR